MSSQIATKPDGVAREPKRQRGRLRVAAIMETGREVFMEKGYDAATMTEIAARSGTAIGSLYRFFPSKESLADALLQRYAQLTVEELNTLTVRATDMTPEDSAGALVDFMLSMRSERTFATALLDARGTSENLRAQFREAMRQGIAAVVRKVIPRLPRAKSEAMAIILLHILKVVPRTEDEDPATRRTVLSEIRELIRLYLVSVQ
jgi:AcrR family transcriptional regulator